MKTDTAHLVVEGGMEKDEVDLLDIDEVDLPDCEEFEILYLIGKRLGTTKKVTRRMELGPLKEDHNFKASDVPKSSKGTKGVRPTRWISNLHLLHLIGWKLNIT